MFRFPATRLFRTVVLRRWENSLCGSLFEAHEINVRFMEKELQMVENCSVDLIIIILNKIIWIQPIFNKQTDSKFTTVLISYWVRG